MSLFKSETPTRATVDTDALLQNSYLLVVELRQGGLARSNHELWNLCATQVENVRQALKDAGLARHSVDHISHAQCALLDETVFAFAETGAKEKWTSEPLQARFFNRHQAGEFLYEEMREVLSAPAPDPHVVTVYQRVLMLGFLGRYRDIEDSERGELVQALNARVAPLHVKLGIEKQLVRKRTSDALRWPGSPLAHGVAAALLVVGLWWGLDHYLGQLIASLARVKGQA
jgi:type VI secretion system protein ImpK